MLERGLQRRGVEMVSRIEYWWWWWLEIGRSVIYGKREGDVHEEYTLWVKG